jgi:chemotaxis signal transduction protein
MNEREETKAGGLRPHSNTPGEACELLLMRAGGQLFAVRVEEADGVPQPCPRPTPLPRAPRAVLGVVCLRGRMRTVLDPLALLNTQAGEDAAQSEPDAARLETDAAPGVEPARDEAALEEAAGNKEETAGSEAEAASSKEETARVEEAARRLVVTLRGDEQLALAFERAEGIVRVPAEAIAPPQRPAPPLRAALELMGARLLVLDPSRLFDAAMRGAERRRPRAVNRKKAESSES